MKSLVRIIRSARSSRSPSPTKRKILRIYQDSAERLRPDFPALRPYLRRHGRGRAGPPQFPYCFYRTRFPASISARHPPRGRARLPGSGAPCGGALLDLDRMRREAEATGAAGGELLRQGGAQQTLDVSVRELFTRLAEVERGHERKAERAARRAPDRERGSRGGTGPPQALRAAICPAGPCRADRRLGLDPRPLFAAAFATQNNWETFLVGLAASVGAGISMGLTEALSDDGEITGRGSPWLRGLGLRRDDRARRPRPHPALSRAGFLAQRLRFSRPASRALVVAVELVAISWIRTKFMDTPSGARRTRSSSEAFWCFWPGIFIGSA